MSGGLGERMLGLVLLLLLLARQDGFCGGGDGAVTELFFRTVGIVSVVMLVM
mgnify:CR=1 FL=1